MVQLQLDLVALNGIRLVGYDVIKDAGGIVEEAPVGEVAEGDNVAVVEQDLIGGAAPALRGQRILVVQIVVQVQIVVPDSCRKVEPVEPVTLKMLLPRPLSFR